MQALLDGDIISYRCAASCQKQGITVDPVEVAMARADELIHRILFETSADSYRIFIGGPHNFRYEIYSEYKANRKDVAKPEWLEAVREHLVTAWKAELADKIETDDCLGIYQTDNTIICSIDKDLLQIPGKHYNFVKQEFYDISEIQGRRNFWMQMVLGDRSDNIPGYDGKMRNVVPKFLKPIEEEIYAATNDDEMKTIVFDIYEDKEQFGINRQLFHILREPLAKEEDRES